MRHTATTILLLAAGLLAVVASPIRAESPDGMLGQEILRDEIRRDFVQGQLGRSCQQRLNDARVEMQLLELSEMDSPGDDPVRGASIKDALRYCGTRLARKLLVNRLRLEERRDALRDRMRRDAREDGDTGVSLGISPRLRVGSHSTLGARFRLRGTRSARWSGLAMTVAGALESSDVKLSFSYDRPSVAAWVAFHTEHPELGRCGEFGVRLSL